MPSTVEKHDEPTVWPVEAPATMTSMPSMPRPYAIKNLICKSSYIKLLNLVISPPSAKGRLEPAIWMNFLKKKTPNGLWPPPPPSPPFGSNCPWGSVSKTTNVSQCNCLWCIHPPLFEAKFAGNTCWSLCLSRSVTAFAWPQVSRCSNWMKDQWRQGLVTTHVIQTQSPISLFVVYWLYFQLL